MKRIGVFIAITLLLISFSAAAIITSRAIEDNNESDDDLTETETDTGNQNQIGLNNSEDELEEESNETNNLQKKIKIKNQLKNKIENAFCGTSTLGICETDEDCIIGGCSNSVCQSKNEEPSATACKYRDCYDKEKYDAKCVCKKNRCIWNKITQNQIKNIVRIENRIRAEMQSGECPEKCACAGSVTKCQLANGTREMTIVAGKSGNMIVQVKGINASTKVALYKSEDGKLYGVFKNNETKIVKLLPNQIREKIRERLARQLENEEMNLNEEGDYEYEAQKRARLFLIIPVRVAVRAELDPETGKIIRLRNSWWSFLAKDESEQTVGASCGTVSPDSADECCQNKEFDLWNGTTGECEFSSEE